VISQTARPRDLIPDSYDVTSLAISSNEADLGFLRNMFDDSNWKLLIAHTYREAMTQLSLQRMPIVLCERQLPDGNWKDVLSQLAPILNRPRLIVISRCADEKLWAEVLNMGGFDLLATPFREEEVGFAIGSAWLDWKNEQERRSGPAG
jgi:DNA-binding response OmpR family regulator